MSESVSLPALGERVTEGTVTRWLKNVGAALVTIGDGSGAGEALAAPKQPCLRQPQRFRQR